MATTAGKTKPRSPKGRAREAAARLAVEYPEAECELDFSDPWELLVATILSAQCTDERVNQVTPKLFAAYPTPEDFVAADPEDVERIIYPTGFFRNKAKSIRGAAMAIVDVFHGNVPDKMEQLVTVPGVGRKTANVMLHVAFAKPGIAVDTHVIRLSRRLGMVESRTTDPVKIEHEIYGLIPKRDAGSFGMRLILHGRRVCTARKPACGDCCLADFCPSAFSGLS